MANILGITAFSSGAVFKQWWQWALVAIIGASGLVGVLAAIWTLYKPIKRLFKVSLKVNPYGGWAIAYSSSSRATSIIRLCPDPFKSGYIFYRKVRPRLE
jgi:hypothetical protein